MELSAYYLKMRMSHAVAIVLSVTSFTLYAQDFPEMVEVKGGSFVMGDESGDKDEKPRHEVQVNTFTIAKTETTVRQWRVFCSATKRTMPESPWFG
ncbi:MAG TPA: SUMF1/EgtB/PvdO family nonheme iron enzyme, partial [Chryseolinea sp.]